MVKALDLPLDARLLTLIVAMGFVTAGYPSYVAHPITLLAPVPLLVALLLLGEARLVSVVPLAMVAAMMIWTALLYLAMAGTARGLVYSLSMYAPFAALAFRIKRPEPVVLAFAVVTATLVSARMVASFIRSGADWSPWQVYEGNDMSARLNLLLPLVLLAWLAVPPHRRRERALILLVLGAGVTSIVLAQQRAGLAGMAVLILIGLARTTWKSLLVVGGLLLAVWLFASESILSVLERARFVNFVPSNATRPRIWRIALEAARESSWLGVGPGNSGDALREVGGGHAHNSLVQTTLEAGWPGALILTGFAIYLIVQVARLVHRGGKDTLVALSLLAYMGFSIVSSPIGRPDFTLALVLVIMVARERVQRRGERCAP